MNLDPEKALAHLEQMADELERARVAVETCVDSRDDAIALCLELKVSPALIAVAAGVSRPRVQQIKAGMAEIPEENADELRVSTSEDVVLSTNGHDDKATNRLVDTMPLLSGVVTVRDTRAVFGRRAMTYAVPMQSLRSLTEHGAHVVNPGESVRVIACGDVPRDGAASGAEAVRAWALGQLADGWETESAYLADPDLPTIRLRGPLDRELVIIRAGAWFGTNDVEPAAAQDAFAELEKLVAVKFPGGKVGDSPATTGRALWLRTIPKDREYPVMSDEVRELIRETSGQGRIELCVPDEGTRAPKFTQYDGRFMYAAHAWGLGVGQPKLWTPDMGPDGVVGDHDRGWWHVTATVPDGWDRPGMLPLKLDGGGWEYPAEPGRTFDTWCDSSEVYMARAYGWTVRRVEGLSWAEGKPLNTWRDKLIDCWSSTDNELVRKALRSMLLFTIGAFATTGHPVTRSTSQDTPEKVSDAAIAGSITRAGDRIVWQEPAKVSEWTAKLQHPEWSSCVWGRVRARMAQLGAQSPAGDVLGFATDAIYLANESTVMGADDGRPGRMRIKAQLAAEPVTVPRSWPALHELRDAGTAAWEARA